MENITIEKLNNAIAQLMNAYEILQAKNKTLENENHELKNTIQVLEAEKNNLENEKSNLYSTKEEESSQMNSMLNKIETMLTSDNLKISTPSLDFNNEQQLEDTTKIEQPVEQIQEPANIQPNTTKEVVQNPAPTQIQSTNTKNGDSTKIDLNRMESLLKGM